MFLGAPIFNQNIGNWNTSAVTDLFGMFASALDFNQDISNWDTAAVTNMSGMFSGALAFNQNIGNWNTAVVTDMSFMFAGGFEGVNAFDQNIGNWDTSSVTDMNNMFSRASIFNQDISNWNTQSVTNMSEMFFGAETFNQEIGNWNVDAVINMSKMFDFALSFNGDISNWNTASAADMSNMFRQVTSFNQDLSNWTLNPNVSMVSVLDNSGIDCDNYTATLVGWEVNNPSVINRNLGATGMTYGTSAVAARDILTNDRGWTITGDTASGDACDASLSTADFDVVNQMKVYPNPSGQEFTLKFNSMYQDVEVKIYNISGQIVLNKTFQNRDVISLEIKDGRGIYFLKVKADNQSSTHKLIHI